MKNGIPSDDVKPLITLALNGDREAMASLVCSIQPLVYKLALRFLMNPADADDATQDILLKIITRLQQFNGDSRFITWVYRISTNHLLDIGRRRPMPAMGFDDFADDLASGLADNDDEHRHSPDQQRLLSEVRIGCTLALLQCLSAETRLSYILGEILELDHHEAAQTLQITPATHRKRLSRSRQAVETFTTRHCGLANPDAPCRCHRRVDKAVSIGRVDPDNLVFASTASNAAAFPAVLNVIRSLDEIRRAAALYRQQILPEQSGDFSDWLRSTLDQQSALWLKSTEC